MKKIAKRSRIKKNKDSLTVGEQESFIGHNLWELYSTYVKLLTKQTESRMMLLNLTQWRTLTLIHYNPDQTQHALSKTVGIDPSSMTPVIDYLERRRWIKRYKSKTNRSAHNIRMTETGKKAFNEVNKELKKMEKRIVTSLGQKDSEKLNEILHNLRNHLEAEL